MYAVLRHLISATRGFSPRSGDLRRDIPTLTTLVPNQSENTIHNNPL
jgi:hypothetical protein